MIDSKLDNAIQEAAGRVRVETEDKLQPLREAHRIVGDLLLRLVHQGSFEASSPNEGQSQRMSLTAGLIQSVSVSNNLIVSGFYWSAAAVLRQQMEAVARVVEYAPKSIRAEQRCQTSRFFPTALLRTTDA